MAIDAERALAVAVAEQTDESLGSWAATGRSGLAVLYNFLRGTYEPSWPGVHPKDAIDGIAAAVGAIAAKHPKAFMETFSDAAFEANVEVLVGLGWIDDPEATRRLLAAADSSNQWVRMQAIIGLGRRHTAEVEAALIRAISDIEYLVRYHALSGLAATGTVDALPALYKFLGGSAYERQLARTAIERIDGRSHA